MKICIKCGEEKQLSSFYRKNDMEDKHENVCKTCKARYKREHYQLNKADLQEKHKRYVDANRESVNAYKREWQRSNPDKVKDAQLWHEYRIRLSEYNSLLEQQGGVCKICKHTSEVTLAVDHDHTTGNIRGLLCRACNTALGLFEDNVERLQNAMNYLNRGGTSFQSGGGPGLEG